MTVQTMPDGSAQSADDADLARLYEAVLRVLEGGDIDGLAVALGQVPDPAGPPASQSSGNKTGGFRAAFRLSTRLQPGRQA